MGSLCDDKAFSEEHPIQRSAILVKVDGETEPANPQAILEENNYFLSILRGEGLLDHFEGAYIPTGVQGANVSKGVQEANIPKGV